MLAAVNTSVPSPILTTSPAVLPSEMRPLIVVVVPVAISKVGSPATVMLFEIVAVSVTANVADSVDVPIKSSCPVPKALALAI